MTTWWKEYWPGVAVVVAVLLCLGGSFSACRNRIKKTHDAFPRDTVAVIDTGTSFNTDMTKAYNDDTIGCWVFHGDAVPEPDRYAGSNLVYFEFKDSKGQEHQVRQSNIKFAKRYPDDATFRAENPDTSRCDQVRPSWEGGHDNRPLFP